MIWLILIPLLVVATALSIVVGPGGGVSLPALMETDPQTAWLILTEIRLPSVVTGLLVGFVLGVSGAALQGFLRNPLAEPGTLGTAGGAALGAVATFHFGFVGLGVLALPLGGIAGALAALMLVVLLAGRNASTTTLILAGIAMSLFTGAATTLLLNLAPNPFAVYEVLFWTMGSVTDRSWEHVFILLPCALIGLAVVMAQARSFDALTLGEEAATSLGVNMARLRFAVVIGTGISVGAAVAVAGVIGFVGLIVPHIVRPLMGHAPGRSLVPSGIAGALLVTLADIAARLVETSGEPLRLGVLTGLMGAPFFLWLIMRTRRKGST
ncbi:MAG: FecCD family ABC transporter permease [Alphaproteobacteria bacterium]